MEIRNIAIIAHVDHGKTTLTDALMRQNGTGSVGDSMDSNALEQERGITIYSKNTSIPYKGTKINIVDTPGHADFGSEVERVLRSIDSVLLVVDAQEGPMPQTRFVLKKSLELGIKPILVINKIDKPASDPKGTHDLVFELFMELGANDEQLNFPTIYAIGREGIAMKDIDDKSENLNPLLDVVLEHVKPTFPAPGELVAQIFNLGYDNFMGRLAIARVYNGTIKTGEQLFVKHDGAQTRIAKITKLYTFEGISRKEVSEATTGDIVIFAGIPDAYIGETLCGSDAGEPMPAIAIDEPTISLNFLINDSPFAGREGKYVTSRQIKERLEKEMEMNVGLKVDFDSDNYVVYGRGELHIAILLENMRREGYEMQVSQPHVIIKEIDGHKMEPYEEVIIDVPTISSGAVIEKITKRKGLLQEMKQKENSTRLIFEMPTRGLLGYRGQFVVDTKGEGIISSRFTEFKQYAGTITKREAGSMTSMIAGKAVAFALSNLQDRGVMYIEHGTDVYEGMVIGNVLKGDEMSVNPIKGKNLTNVRASGTDDALVLKPAYTLSIERGLEVMGDDEYLEVTPKSVRLRKKILKDSDRVKSVRKT